MELIPQATSNETEMPTGSGNNKLKGRMSAYAIYLQTCLEEHRKRHPDEKVEFTVFSEKCYERWNTMSKTEKQRFFEKAEQDKMRYELDMKKLPPNEIMFQSHKQMKNPNAPKRPLSAFFWFCNDERSNVMDNNPEYTLVDISKELGRRWIAADSEIKSKYECLYEQDKARYDRELAAYIKEDSLASTQPQDVPPLESLEIGHEKDREYDESKLMLPNHQRVP